MAAFLAISSDTKRIQVSYFSFFPSALRLALNKSDKVMKDLCLGDKYTISPPRNGTPSGMWNTFKGTGCAEYVYHANRLV